MRSNKEPSHSPATWLKMILFLQGKWPVMTYVRSCPARIYPSSWSFLNLTWITIEWLTQSTLQVIHWQTIDIQANVKHVITVVCGQFQLQLAGRLDCSSVSLTFSSKLPSGASTRNSPSLDQSWVHQYNWQHSFPGFYPQMRPTFQEFCPTEQSTGHMQQRHQPMNKADKYHSCPSPVKVSLVKWSLQDLRDYCAI